MNNSEIYNLTERCRERWKIAGREKRFEDFARLVPDFLNKFSEQEQKLMVELIDQFNYYSHSLIAQYLMCLHNKVKRLKGFNEERAIFCVLKSLDGKINSSTEYVLEYRKLNKISKYSIIPDVADIPLKQWEYINSLVFIDDYCGSGTTFSTFLEKYIDLLKNKEIIYSVIHIMREEKEKLIETTKAIGINLRVVTIDESSKSFTGNRSEKDKEVFEKASEKVGIIGKEGIWGYKLTEALVAFYNNTPNNTLGVFRINTGQNKAIFPRKKEKIPEWRRLGIEKQERNISRYENAKKNHNG